MLNLGMYDNDVRITVQVNQIVPVLAHALDSIQVDLHGLVSCYSYKPNIILRSAVRNSCACA